VPQGKFGRILTQLQEIVGRENVFSDPERLVEWGRDWTRGFIPDPLAIVLPKTTLEVSSIVKLCGSMNLPIVPSGGRTGLVGGAVAARREIVLSLGRMNQIIALDPRGMTIEVEAGATTEQVQDAAKAVGLYYPVDLASKGSCHIGGNIATNAGGLKVIRFGATRNHVLGIEVVMPSGSILDLNRKLIKNNSGYDLKHLFIASEGTLGIITKASLRLYPPLGALRVSCLGVRSLTHLSRLLDLVSTRGISLTAFEFFSEAGLALVLEHIPGSKRPLREMCAYYALMEVEESHGNQFESWLEGAMDDGMVVDAVLSSSSEEFREIWSLRENMTEAIGKSVHVFKNDLALPLSAIAPFLSDIQERGTRDHSLQLILFGHLGDGNVHINYIGDRSLTEEAFMGEVNRLQKHIFETVHELGGTISAEHGIGLIKKQHLKSVLDSTELELMRGLKGLFDPGNIMNPGKIIDLH